MMTEQQLDAWIEALRSGRYPQIDGALHTDHGYCCLGVGLEIVQKCEWNRKLHGARECFYPVIDGFDHYMFTGTLPPEWAKSLGLREPVSKEAQNAILRKAPVIADSHPDYVSLCETHAVCENHWHDFLMQLNDHNVSFAEIADILDEHFRPLVQAAAQS